MSQSPGYIDPFFPSHVCKLNKAIDGLKQASRAWYDELRHPTISYPSLFHISSNTSPTYIIVYLDDIIITGPNLTQINQFIQSLSSRFLLKDLGPLSYFLGIEVIPHNHGLFLSQSKYIHDILQRANMLDSKPASTPMTSHPLLLLNHGTPLSNPTTYHAIVDALQYLSLIRSDVTFPVNKLSQFYACSHKLTLASFETSVKISSSYITTRVTST